MVWPIYSFFCATTSPYSRTQTTLNQTTTLKPLMAQQGAGGKSLSSGGDLYYMDHVAGRITGWEDLDLSTSTSGEHQTALKTKGVIYTVQTWITDETFTETLSGNWSIYTECKYTNAVPFGDAVFFRWKVQKRNNGTTTLLFTTDWTTVSTVQSIRYQTVASSGSMSGDYLVFTLQSKWDTGVPF